MTHNFRQNVERQDFKQSIVRQVNATYVDERLAIIDELRELSVFSDSLKMESYAAALLVQGSASFFVDGEAHEMRANDLFIFRPNITLERTMVSADAEYCIVVLSPEYVESLALLSGTNIDLRYFFERNPVISLAQEHVRTFVQYYNILRSKLVGRKTRYHKELVDSLLSAFLYDFYDVLEQSFHFGRIQYNSAEVLFRRFHDMLWTSEQKFQKVEYFAERLNITPKYFSAICKRITGKTALQIITEAVVKDCVKYLRNDTLSIKEIASKIGFPNQSFFGSYVKKHLGCSPQKYRERLTTGEI